MNIPTKKLKSGFELPVYGLGLWQMGGRLEVDKSKDAEEITAIKAAVDYGVKISGVTVHIANEEYDKGSIIEQEAVRIEADDTLVTFEEKIHKKEYEILPAVISQFASEKRAKLS
jgi:folate-dependent phosphoribosylglycinamide formyltransferase PurN